MKERFFVAPQANPERAVAPLVELPAFREQSGREPSSPANFTPELLARCSEREGRNYLAYKSASRLKVLPLGVLRVLDQDVLTVAAAEEVISDPRQQFDLLHALRFAAGCEIKLIPVARQVLEQAIFIAYRGDEEDLQAKVLALRESDETHQEQGLIQISPLSYIDPQGITEPAKFLNSLIEYAIAHRASDLHITPRRNGSVLRIRLNGKLLSHDQPVCTLRTHEQLMNRLKILSALDTTVRTEPQDGSLHTQVQGQEIRIRLSIMPTVHGEKAVLRFTGFGDAPELEELGLGEQTRYFLETVCERNEGGILLCGPTGSGKTTTLYALMDYLSHRNLHLVSIEDPVEMYLVGVSQTAIDLKNGLTFAKCLRSTLRQDPDVILLGEIRDNESAQIAFQAAITGHLVFSTVHARNVCEVFLRLQHLGVDPLSLAQGLQLIICQRLTPQLCERCKVIDLTNSRLLQAEVYQPVGCVHCDYSGFFGRALVEEALLITDEIAKEISLGNIRPDQIQRHFSQSCYVTMNDKLLDLTCRGIVPVRSKR